MAPKRGVRYPAMRRDHHGPKNPRWKGGRHVRTDGRTLIYAPGHPGANVCGGIYILEYRLIAEQMLGRPLRDDEIVHHINGDVADNRPENLQVMAQAEHAKLHLRRATPSDPLRFAAVEGA